MAATPFPPPGDVSCRATGSTIQQLQRMGLPTEHLTRGITGSLQELQSHAAEIPWDDYLVFLQNSYTNLSADQFVELCTSFYGSPSLRPLLSAAGLRFHPAKYFQWVADPESGAIRQLFRCVRTRFTRVGEREVLIEEVINPGYALPPDLFWQTQSIGFGALTTSFGLGPSFVTWEPVDRGAVFRVRLPRRRPVRFVLSWLASWFRRDTAEEVRSALSYGHERSLRLESEIAERKTAEAARRESEERLRRISDAVPGIVYQYYLESDGRQGFLFASGGATGLTGFTPAELIARPEIIWAQIDPDDIPGVRHSILDSARTGTPWEREFRFRTKDGESRWIRGRSIPEPVTGSGRVVWNGILTDVTAEKQADAQLRASDALLRKLSEQVPGVIYQYQQWPDGRSRFPYASEGIRDIYEVTPEEVRGSAEAVFGRLHPDDLGAVAESIRRSLETLEPWGCEYRVVLPTRGTRWLDGHAAPERMPDGSTIWHGYIRDVTNRKLAEDSIRESETRFRTLIEDLDVGVVLQDETDRVLVSNAAAASTLGLTPDQLHGVTSMDPGWELVRDDGTPLPPGQVPSVVAARTRRPVRNVVLGARHRQTGHRTWLQVNATPRLNADGSLWHVLVSLVDITERKRAEEALRASEEKIRAIVDGEPECVKLLDRGGHLLEMNPAGLRMIEADDLAHVRGAHVGALVAPPDREAFGDMVAAVFRGESGSLVFEIEGLKGARRTVETHSVPMWDADRREVRALLGVTRDITEQKAAEQALVEEKSLLQAIFASLPGIAFAFDQRGRYVRWNHNYEKLLGYPDPEMARLTALDTVVPRDRERVAAVIRDVFAVGESTTQLHALTKDGRELPLFCTGVRVTLGGQPCVVGFGIDISGRLRAEAALRESEERLRIFVESAPAGVAMLDRDVRYLSYSRRWLADYGLGDQNLVGRSHYEVFREMPDRWKEIHRRCLTGVSERCEQDRFERADGTVDYLRWEIQPWADATGAVGGLVFFTEMITNRVKAEEQVRASLREKEAMLKEIHHRVKNNLQVVSSLLSLQAARVTHPVATDVLAESQNRVRAMALVHETLYRSDDLARVDLSRYLGELCGYLFRSYGVDSARVRLELDVEPVSVSLDKTIPCGLLVNEIVSNSLKHAFPGARTGGVTVRAGTRADGRLTLTLADDGVGLPADVVVDQTPSLGLQLVNILTEQLGGHLAVERSPGTRFTVSFTP